MDFFPYKAPDGNTAQRAVWDALRRAFAGEPGAAYYRYHIFPRDARFGREPDILVLHRWLGVVVLECKGCRVGNVAAVNGTEWVMRDWYADRLFPVLQAEEQMFAVENRFRDSRAARGLMAFHYAVALPFVTRAEWAGAGFDAVTGQRVLTREDLTPGAVGAALARLAAGHPQRPLTDPEWEAARAVLRGGLPQPPPREVPTTTPPDSPARAVRAVEERLRVLDDDQNRAAFQIPPGPQRLRGLAGTGKTVLLAQRAAAIRSRHPEWRTAFVFFTRSLYDQARGLLAGAYRGLTGDAPPARDGRHLVLHAWGSGRVPGFYRTLAQACGVRPLAARDVPDADRGSPYDNFRYACRLLLDQAAGRVPELFDAVLVDEGQDLPPEFYRLAYQALSPPKRLYWAYDEAQGTTALAVPTARLLFGEEGGRPAVDVAGWYEGGIERSVVFRRCYRTPRAVLMAAHAVHMGLFRAGGAVQGVTTRRGWDGLGYEVVEGDFRSPGTPVRVRRPDPHQAHPADADPAVRATAGPTLRVETFDREADEIAWVAGEVAADLGERGLRPDDVLVTALRPDHRAELAFARRAADALEGAGVAAYVPGEDPDGVEFRRAGRVTVATLARAKGNEAWKVYVLGFQHAAPGGPAGDEVRKRNEAFVALTRTRLWCVVTGVGHAAPAFAELRRAAEQQPELCFPAFNQRQLHRPLDDEEGDEADGRPEDGRPTLFDGVA